MLATIRKKFISESTPFLLLTKSNPYFALETDMKNDHVFQLSKFSGSNATLVIG